MPETSSTSEGKSPTAYGRPRLERAGALGWSDVALDGLNCYLRCVESVLRWQGLSGDELALALVGPVDLLRRARSGSEYDSHTVEWQIAEDGCEHWELLAQTLTAGIPVVLMPDRFGWPGDEFEGRRHFHDHTVLAYAVTDHTLSVLDTDASPAAEHVREVPITPGLRRACTRWGVVRAVASASRTVTRLHERLVRPSLPLLAQDIPELRSFAEQWHAEGLDDLSAHALHIAVLGDFQPVLFLFAEAGSRLGGLGAGAKLDSVFVSARKATRRAKSLGLLLLALHREPSSDAYMLALANFELFLESLEGLHEAIVTTLGERFTSVEADGAFGRRLQELARYCFDSTSARELSA